MARRSMARRVRGPPRPPRRSRVLAGVQRPAVARLGRRIALRVDHGGRTPPVPGRRDPTRSALIMIPAFRRKADVRHGTLVGREDRLPFTIETDPACWAYAVTLA